MLSLYDVGTVKWSRPIVENHGLPMTVSNSLFFGALLQVPGHRLVVVVIVIVVVMGIVNHFGLDVDGGKDPNAKVLGHLLGHKPGLVQGFATHWALLYFLDDFDDAIRLVLILEEVVLLLLGRITPVLFGQPFLDKASQDDLLRSVLLHQLAEEHERKLLRHVTEAILVEPFVAKLLQGGTIEQAVLQ